MERAANRAAEEAAKEAFQKLIDEEETPGQDESDSDEQQEADDSGRDVPYSLGMHPRKDLETNPVIQNLKKLNNKRTYNIRQDKR